MRRGVLVSSIALVAGLGSSSAMASSINLWDPADISNDVVTVGSSVFGQCSSCDYSIFGQDATDLDDADRLDLGAVENIEVAQVGAGWEFNAENSGDSLTLESSNRFIFAVDSDGDGAGWSSDLASVTSEGANDYSLEFSGVGGGIAASNVSQVPIPAAGVLFMTSVVGLVAVGRRNKGAQSGQEPLNEGGIAS